jgi:hypothetical protein
MICFFCKPTCFSKPSMILRELWFPALLGRQKQLFHTSSDLMESTTTGYPCVENKAVVVHQNHTNFLITSSTRANVNLTFQVLWSEVDVDGCVTIRSEVHDKVFLKDSKKRKIKFPSEVHIIAEGPIVAILSDVTIHATVCPH